jgi:RND family efflux transporter MFP subunit
LLYEIDSREIDSKKQQAAMGLEMYENQYMNVKLNLERFKRLLKKDMVSKYEVENLELAKKNLNSMITISKARLSEVNNQYQYLKIKAPNDGVIIQKNIKVGEMAMPGMPALILSDLSNLKIIVEVSESNLAKVKVGKEVNIQIPSIKLNIKGSVSAIIPSSNPLTHTFKIKISFDKKQHSIYPGMYAKVIL